MGRLGDGSSYSSESSEIQSSNTRSTKLPLISSVPTGIFALALLLIAIPNGFPYHGLQSTTKKSLSGILTLESLRRIDFVGAILLLVASMLFVAALQVAEIYYPWSSSLVISFLAVSGAVLVFFLGYEWLVSHTDRHPEPVFPWRFLKNRVWMGTILYAHSLSMPCGSVYLLLKYVVIVSSLELHLQWSSLQFLNGFR